MKNLVAGAVIVAIAMGGAAALAAAVLVWMVLMIINVMLGIMK